MPELTKTTTSESVVAEAIAHYDDLLRAANLTDADYAEFQDKVVSNRITFGGRSSCPYLRPQFVSAEQWEAVKQTSVQVNAAMDKVGAIIQADPSIRELLCLTEGERTVIAPDPGYPWLTPTCRYDSFLGEHHFAYVELNAECPAGPAFTTALANLWLELPIMKAFKERFVVETFDVRQPLLAMLLRVYATWRENTALDRPERPTIAVVDYLDVPTVQEFELCREYFESCGYRTLVADPRDLRYEGGRLRSKDGEAIDLVYRRLLTNEFLDRFDELQDFWLSYRDGAVCVVNPFRSKLLHKKMIFGILTDQRVLSTLSSEEQAAIKRTVPWTRLVRAGETTTLDGQTIDLLPWIRANREQLVLKPNDEYGGKGIYIGWESSESQWEAGLVEAQQSPYVVQWRVHAPQVAFPVWGEAGLTWEVQTIDLDPYMFFGEAYGFLTRLSTTALCNVTAGGGIVPTFVVSKK